MTPNDVLSWLVPCVVALGIPASGWLFNRLSKARGAENREAITAAVTAVVDGVKSELRGHIDNRVDGVEARLVGIETSVAEVSGREAATALRLARLEGRFDQHTRGATP